MQEHQILEFNFIYKNIANDLNNSTKDIKTQIKLPKLPPNKMENETDFINNNNKNNNDSNRNNSHSINNNIINNNKNNNVSY